LNNPPPILLILLPYAVNFVVKIVSSLVSKKSRRQSMDEILSRNKPQDKKDLLEPDQLVVLEGAISLSSLYVTVTTTLIGSVFALLVITVKSALPWLWWVLVAVVCVAIGMWIWIYTRKSYSAKGFFSIPVGTWALIVFCAFDIGLAVLSVFVTSSQAQPANSN
jgi:hypothetical protein